MTEKKKIEHSGRVFESMPSLVPGERRWPADEFIVRHRFTDAEADRIRKFNPHGIADGSGYSAIAGLPVDFPNKKYFR